MDRVRAKPSSVCASSLPIPAWRWSSSARRLCACAFAAGAGVPVWALQAGATLLGKGDAVQRLCGNLQVDISKARSLLGWVPPISSDEGLRRTVGGALHEEII